MNAGGGDRRNSRGRHVGYDDDGDAYGGVAI